MDWASLTWVSALFLRLGEQALGLGLAGGQVLVGGLLRHREDLHRLHVVIRARRDGRGDLALGSAAAGWRALRLGHGPLRLLERLARLVELGLGLRELLLELDDLLLGAVLALREGLLQLADVTLQSLVLLAGRLELARRGSRPARLRPPRAPLPAPPSALLLPNRARRSLFSSIRRESSTSTMSRKASTSSSS